MNRLKVFARFISRMVLVAAFALPALASSTAPALAASGKPGAVFTMTNAAGGNEVLAYSRAADGSLAFQGAYATGGLGSGAGLGSQGSLALSSNNRWLFAVNAGSNQVSVFRMRTGGLELTDVVDSGGSLPISLTSYQNMLYVLNAGDAGNISGFWFSEDGHLTAIDGSTQPLSNGGAGAAPGPAQVSFSPDGGSLVVTEKATNLIDAYAVVDGVASPPNVFASPGMTPFGFAFNRHGILIVSEAAGGAAGASSASSYQVAGGQVELVSPAVGTTQTAACWVAVSKNGKFAYTTNAGSGSVSSYRVYSDGSISLMNATAGLTGAGSSPIDINFSQNSPYLYVLNNGAHTISIFQAGGQGELTSLGGIEVPVGVVGLAVR